MPRKIYQRKGKNQRAIREQMREEEKGFKEIEKVQQDAEKKRHDVSKSSKVREQLLSAKAEEMGELKLKIETLEKSLK